MTLEEKIEVVKQNKDSCIAALQATIDTFLNLRDVTDPQKLQDEKAIKAYQDVDNDIHKYDNIRIKLEKNDYDLSLLEVSYISVALWYCQLSAEKKIAVMKKAQQHCFDLYTKLAPGDERPNGYNTLNDSAKKLQKM